jgi:hypothetical protein
MDQFESLTYKELADVSVSKSNPPASKCSGNAGTA